MAKKKRHAPQAGAKAASVENADDTERVEVVIPPQEEEPAAPPLEESTGDITTKTVFDGALFRRIRESKGLTLKAIGEKTRINHQSLAAIEEERYEDLPDAKIYIRGFVRCLAQEIGLNADRAAAGYLERWDRWREGQNIPKKPLLVTKS